MTHWSKPRPGIGLTGPLVALAFVVVVIGLARWWHDPLPPEAVCPPFWKCNGTPATNAAGCDCWDRY